MIYNKSRNLYIENINLNMGTSCKNLYEGMITESYKDIYESEYNMSVLTESFLLEGVSLKDFFENAKRIIITAFNKFTEIKSKIINSFIKMVSSNNILSEKYKSSIYKGYNILKNKNEEINGIAYNTENINRYSRNISGDRMKGQIAFLKNIAISDARYHGKYDEYDLNRAGIIDYIISDNDDYNYNTIEELVAHIENNIIISQKANLIEHYKSGENICSIMRGISHRDIESEYKRVKSIVKDCINGIDDAYKSLLKADSKSHSYDLYTGRKLFTELTNHVNFIQNACQDVSLILSKARFNELVQTRKFALMCISAYEEENNKQGG